MLSPSGVINHPVSNIKKMTETLEASITQYYVYEEDNIVLPDIRAKAIQREPRTWKFRWGERYANYALGEIRWLEALESHPLRTRNASEATFFVVPIPVGAVLYWGSNVDLRSAFETILNGSMFQQNRKRHVAAFATTERVWGGGWWGLSNEAMNLFNTSMIVRDSNRVGLANWYRENELAPCPEFLQSFDQRHSEDKYFSHVLSLGFGGEGSNPSIPYSPVTMESWSQKRFWFFYHTTEGPSVCNSTLFRHAFFSNETKPGLFKHQPVTIGTDIPKTEWQEKIADSKFCLVIRGDTPGSRSLQRAIRAGCIPLVISDSLPVFQSLYSKTLHYSDFALLVKEESFINDPVGSLDKAVSLLSPSDLKHKLKGLCLMQRIIAVDKPDSLFVPAFSREIVETMKENGLITAVTGGV